MTAPAFSATQDRAPGVRVSVSIVYFDTDPDVFRRTLSQLGRALQPLAGRAEVVVVDNADRLDENRIRATLAGAANDRPVAIRLLAGHGNVGFGGGHNLALSAVDPASYHLVLNPDVYLAPDFFTRAVDCLEHRRDAVALSPYAETAAGEQQHLCKRYPDLLTLFARASPVWVQQRFHKRIAHYELRDRGSPNAGLIDEVELASGCCLLCRRDALARTGGFDRGYFLYFEDFDLSLRLRAHGRIVHDPACRIVHLGGGVAQKGWRHRLWFLASAVRFFRTHGLFGRQKHTRAAPPHSSVIRS